MVGVNLTVYFNVFENYTLNVLRPPNTKTGEPYLKMISYKYQDNDKLILNNSLGDVKLNKITDTNKEKGLPILGQLYDVTSVC